MQDVTLSIPAGGRSSRMGVAKAGLDVRGKPVLEYLLDRMNWPSPTMLVTAPGDQRVRGSDRFDRHAHDPVPGMGPLRGILTALDAS